MRSDIASYIGHFVKNQFAEAKEILRGKDPAYVNKVESVDQSLSSWQKMRNQKRVGESPKERLNKKWHRLLESCTELYMQSNRLFIAESGLDASNCMELCDMIAGIRFNHSFQSWCIHAYNLAERIQDTMKKAANVYIELRPDRDRMTKHYCKRVKKQIICHIGSLRHKYSHGDSTSSARGITEDQNWEAGIATGNTAREVAELYVHTPRGRDFKQGEYDFVLVGTYQFNTRVGAILRELEQDLKANYNPRNLMRLGRL